MNKILLISLVLSSFAFAEFLSQDNSDDKLKYEFSAKNDNQEISKKYYEDNTQTQYAPPSKKIEEEKVVARVIDGFAHIFLNNQFQNEDPDNTPLRHR